jgi:hypothetical protein
MVLPARNSANQQTAYIGRQLASFAQGIRQNDIGEQMRVDSERPDA